MLTNLVPWHCLLHHPQVSTWHGFTISKSPYLNILYINWLSPSHLEGLNYWIPSLIGSIGSLNQTAFPLIWLIGNNEYLDDKCSLSNLNEIAGNTNNNLSCCILLVPIRACWVLFSPVGSWCVLSILVGLFLLLFGSGSISMSYLWSEYVGTMFFHYKSSIG